MENDTGDKFKKYSIYATILFSKVGSESDSTYCCVVFG